ncbi:MAG: hypothetical protein KF838_15185 [Phycisphaeraceae bacterium]|nr:MAG: hypothetical protein KF838_15185 [Phycisphaeraceae bacterium]
MIASPDLTHDAPHHATPADPISPRQRWAHLLVLDMLRANLPLDRLAAHLNIPFLTLIDYINTPEVQAEIDAYDQLLTIRARLLGQTARPISLRKLLDVLESPAPQPTGRDPESDQRTLHRHAELIRRTATTIARESRALAPKPAPDQRAQKGAPSARAFCAMCSKCFHCGDLRDLMAHAMLGPTGGAARQETEHGQRELEGVGGERAEAGSEPAWRSLHLHRCGHRADLSLGRLAPTTHLLGVPTRCMAVVAAWSIALAKQDEPAAENHQRPGVTCRGGGGESGLCIGSVGAGS